ncbi:MAG: ABC transporter ATP-binding protein [Nitrospinota bacterium]|nr:ABC transporter ATP-binding protein [Nitrospinota bacterium]
MILKIQNVKKYFGGVKAVDDCSFEVEEKKITALLGPNGSGKTSIFNIISGIINVDYGNILLNALDITNKTPEKISNLGISRLFQKARLFENLSVEDNLMLSVNNQDMKFFNNLFGFNHFLNNEKEKLNKILKLLDIEDLQKKFSKELSYGQQRLVEITRTFLNPHLLVLLDEPVAGVNPNTRDKFAKFLLDMKNDGESILLIEHDMRFTFSIADKIIVLHEGKIIAEGSSEEIKNNELVRKVYLGEKI